MILNILQQLYELQGQTEEMLSFGRISSDTAFATGWKSFKNKKRPEKQMFPALKKGLK